LLLVDSLAGLVTAVTALGFAVAPYMISVFTLAERIVPVSRVGAALTLLSGATGIGYALGSGIAGRLADSGGGHRGAFAVAVTAGGLAFVLSAASARRFAAAGLRTPDLVPDSRASCDVSRQPHERSTSNA
jgi:MFS family permease